MKEPSVCLLKQVENVSHTPDGSSQNNINNSFMDFLQEQFVFYHFLLLMCEVWQFDVMC